MAYGTPSNPVAGTVITTAYAIANLLEPIRALRANSGAADPPALNRVAVSTGVGGPTSWMQVPTDAIADLAVATAKLAAGAVTAAKLAAGAAVANIGYTPFNVAGDVVTPGQVRVIRNVGFPANLFDIAHVTLQTPNAAANPAETAAIGFHRTNSSGVALYHDMTGPWLRMMTQGGTVADFWTTRNQGPGTGLDADTVDGMQGTTISAGLVPSGLIAAFATAAAIPAGWTRFAAGNGRVLVGAGTTFGQTFVEGASAGSSWDHLHSASVVTGDPTPPGGPVTGGGSSTAAPAPHTHAWSGNTDNARWIPPSFTIVWAQKS